MRKTKPEYRLTDFPSITVSEAAAIFGWSLTTFKKRFDRIHHLTIQSQALTNSRRYSLVDVIASAYPGASETTVHILAQNFMFRRMEHRSEKLIAKHAALKGNGK